MMRDGGLLAVECKAPGGKMRAEQAEFLSLVRRFGGLAFVARDCRDVLRELSGSDGGRDERREIRKTPEEPQGVATAS